MDAPPKNADELIRRYLSGERAFVGVELDSSVYDLRDATLEGADFSGSYIVADLRGANLRGVSFAQANVKTCDFRGADLRNAIFKRAALEGTQFEGARMEGTSFEGASCFSYELKAGEKPWW